MNVSHGGVRRRSGSCPQHTHSHKLPGTNTTVFSRPAEIMRAPLGKKKKKKKWISEVGSKLTFKRRGEKCEKTIHLLSTLGARASSPRGGSEIPKRQTESSPHSEIISLFRTSGGRTSLRAFLKSSPFFRTDGLHFFRLQDAKQDDRE